MNAAPFPAQGRLGGIDFGTVRIGVAVTDEQRRVASPCENYNRRSPKLDAEYFTELVHGERLVGWVVGLPLHTDGKESQKSIEARAFGEWLGSVTSLPVRYWDERFTSKEAHRALLESGLSAKKRKKRLDMLAAQIMLAAYLERTAHADDMPLASLDDPPD